MAAVQKPSVKELTLLYSSISVFKQKMLELFTLFDDDLNNIFYNSQSM